MNMRIYPGYGLCILVAISGCMCIFLFSKAIESMGIAKLFKFFGKNSLILLMVQCIVPYFFTSKNAYQKAVDMLIECLLVIIYVYLSKILCKLHTSVFMRKTCGK